MTRTMPAPLSLIWGPALRRLARDAQERGCRVILTGDGADEWLGESPFLATDALRSLDLPSVYHLCRTFYRSVSILTFGRAANSAVAIWRAAVATG